MLRTLLSRPVPRPTLLRLHEVAGGNPLDALELARALGADYPVRDPTQPFPVPERLEELVSARLDGFTGATHDALVLASADARLTPALAPQSGASSRAPSTQRSPENVIELANGAVRFTHPLLASVLYQGLAIRRSNQVEDTEPRIASPW